MDFFKRISEIVPEGDDLTIVTRRTVKGIVVSVRLSSNGITETNIPVIAPMILRGTAEEVDAGFFDNITAPVAETAGLHAEIKAFEESKKAAEKKSPVKKDDKKNEAKTTDKAAGKKPESKPKVGEPKNSEPNLLDAIAAAEKTEKEFENEEAASPAVEAETETETETVEETQADEPQRDEDDMPADDEPHAPTAAEVITEDINVIWKRGVALYNEHNYRDALQEFEKCRAIATAAQMPNIDKAIAAANAQIEKSLANK